MTANLRLVKQDSFTEVRAANGALLGLIQKAPVRGWYGWVPGSMVSTREFPTRQQAISYLVNR